MGICGLPLEQEIKGLAALLLAYRALSIKGGRHKMYTIAHKKSCMIDTVTQLSRFLDWSFHALAPKTNETAMTKDSRIWGI
jgi:hypothetical protein